MSAVLEVQKVMKNYLDEVQDSARIEAGLDQPILYERWGSQWVEYTHSQGDIYELLTQYAMNRRESGLSSLEPEAIVLVTTGWAAPLGADGAMLGAPSAHPQRVRVVMRSALELAEGGMLSRLDMAKPEGVEVIEDFGGATGSLADALQYAAMAVWGRKWSQNLLNWYATTNRDELSAEVKAGLVERVQRLTDLLDESEGE